MAARNDLWAGEMRGLVVDGRPVLLVDVEGQVAAFVDRCCHQAFPLSRGRLDGRTITCAVHEWQYDAVSGEGLNPRGVALARFPLEVRDDGGIWVDVDGGT